MAEANSIDWLTASLEDRKILYTFADRARKEAGQTWPEFFDNSLGLKAVSDHYASTFRKGGIDRAKALRIAGYLQKEHAQVTQGLAAAILERRLAASDRLPTWDHLIRPYGRFGGLEVIPVPPLGIVGLAEPEPLSDRSLRLGEHFCFRLTPSAGGFVLALQQSRDIWYPVPLGRSGLYDRVGAATVLLPRDPASGRPIPLSEEDDIGKRRFAFLVADHPAMEELAIRFTPGKPLPPDTAGMAATILEAVPPASRVFYRINVMIEP